MVNVNDLSQDQQVDNMDVVNETNSNPIFTQNTSSSAISDRQNMVEVTHCLVFAAALLCMS